VDPEHFLTPNANLEFSGNHYFDATTAQAYIAGATSTITIGSMVTILPLHNPIVAAKQIATLDWFSGGRAQPRSVSAGSKTSTTPLESRFRQTRPDGR